MSPRAWLEQAVDLFEQSGDLTGQVHALGMLNGLQCASGDYAAALETAEEAVRLTGPDGEALQRAFALFLLAASVWLIGEVERSHALLRRCLSAAEHDGNVVVVGLAFILFTRVACAIGEPELAARTYGAAEHHFTMVIPPFMRELFFDPAAELATDALGREQFENLRKEGYDTTPEEAVALAAH